ncbi:MAG: MFS transporter [Clostridia bacterium]|nr:MFS transporter [Clostridia bacterium]
MCSAPRRLTYNHTLYACYIGYITQAVVNSLAPLLFLHFQEAFSLSLAQITLLTTVNFGVQLCIDFLSTFFVDRIGYRPCVIAAHIFAALGLFCMAWLPSLTAPYAGLMFSVILYAIGGGLIEVLISPIVEACPTEKKEAAMSLLHSFYCWGVAGVILVSTVFFHFFGTIHYQWLTCLLAMIPAFNTFLFARVPIFPIVGEDTPQLSLSALVRNRIFWILLLMMICAGASEQAMSQWASAFAEAGLHLNKSLGDLAGPLAFSLLMGSARALYGRFSDRLPLRSAMLGSALLCLVCYILCVTTKSAVLALIGCALCGFSVGIFWPGTFSMAALSVPGGGTAMYALMALFGDIGCSGGPTLVGLVAAGNSGILTYGLASAMIFPIVMILLLLRKTR